jgi:peptide/nickel transport system substrate-binding protein
MSGLMLLALLCGAAAGCRPSATLPPGYLQVDIETSPLSLDPRFGTDAMSSRIDELLFDSLVRLDEHQRLVGDLASSIERPTPTELVFHLRPGLRFSDGRRLGARDVKYSYESLLAPSSLSRRGAMFNELATITAPDDATVVFRTRRPYAPALEMAMLGVVPYGTPATGGRTLGAPSGSGPFAVEAFARDEYVILRRNP